MKVQGQSGHNNMPCESCAVQFSVFKRRRPCSECDRYYCSACLRRGGGTMCAPCRVLSTQPLSRPNIAHLKVRDLQSFLQRQNVSTRGCVEKEELVSLCMYHVNSPSYRRRGPRTGPFTNVVKGFTSNINEFINHTFDLNLNHNRQDTQRTQHDCSGECYNARHEHAHPPPARPAPPPASAPSAASRERFTTTPGGERDIRVPVPDPSPPVPLTPSSPERVDTDDCYEIEDVDDAGWEFVNRPAEPLPNDSEVLILESEPVPEVRVTAAEDPPNCSRTSSPVPVATEDVLHGVGDFSPVPHTPARAASVLDLHRIESPAAERDADSASLQDEPLMDRHEPKETTPGSHLQLEQIKEASELEALNVRQLKQLLARNRVEFRGCLERADLLQRATMLWNDHNKYKDEIESLPIEECCKICMAAPLECVLLECGHIAACTACAKQLAECPICRQYVVRAVRCFRS